jgi:hypothetical protein
LRMKPMSLFLLTALILAQVLPAVSKQSHASDRFISPNVLTAPQAASARGHRKSTATVVDTGSDRAVLGGTISIQAKGRGKPWITMGDGHELLSSYSGANWLTSKMQMDQARAVSLAAGDLDGDGVPDLLSGFATQGAGIIAVNRGNVDSIYPNSREALARKRSGAFTDAPFLSPARLFAAPTSPDFIETGDFDADGSVDVAIASRGGNTLYIIPGDGSGGLGDAKTIELPGQVTAMTSGDVNRRDGLTDLVVGVTSAGGPKLLVFEGPEGALKSTPEVISLPGQATAISVGYLYNNTYADIAVAAGGFLVTVHGRDRRLSMNAAARAGAPAPTVSKLALPASAKSVTIGKFTADQTSQAAVLMEDGRVEMAGTGNAPSGKLRALSVAPGAKSGAGAQPRLIRARVSGRAGDDLILMDQAASRLRLMVGAASATSGSSVAAVASDVDPIDLDVDDTPIAALPMRLGVSARNDLVVLRRGHLNASIVPQQSTNIFTVTSTEDGPVGTTFGPAAVGSTTFRDTINEALNAEAGSSNEIDFDIPQSGVPIITLVSALPTLPTGSTLTIDGTSQSKAQSGTGATMVEINGAGNNVLVVPGSSDVVRGLVLNNAAQPLQVTGGNNLVEGNFIGTAADGVTPMPNSGSGVLVQTGAGNMIGGTGAGASNVISGNLVDGITITSNATGTMVLGNFVGTDETHTQPIANGGNGVQVEAGGSATTIGSPTSPNYIRFNDLNGVAISSGTNHVVQNNAIQTNSENGLFISGATSSTIGGAQAALLGNLLLDSSQSGLAIAGATGTNVQGNGIGVAIEGGTGIADMHPNGLDGVSISGSSSLIGGEQVALGNDIAFNDADGVAVVSGDGNAILSNEIFADSPGLPIHLFPGANDNAQPPVISGAAVSGGSSSAAAPSIRPAVVVTGSSASPVMVISFAFKSTPNQQFEMQFYVPQICNCTGNCFTDVGIYSTTVTTDAEGNAPSPVSINLTAAPAAGSFVNATATSTSSSDTSEFSECLEVGTGSACDYQLSASSQEISSSGGPGSFTVTTSATCAYTPSDSDSFVHITSGSGLGNGTVTFMVDANTASTSRQSTISVATGVNFTVIEDGVGPNFALAVTPGAISGAPGALLPVTVSITRSGGFTGKVIVTAPAKADGIKPKPGGTTKLKGSNTSYSLNIKITGAAVPGTYPFTFTATGAGLTGTQTATLNVTVQ